MRLDRRPDLDNANVGKKTAEAALRGSFRQFFLNNREGYSSEKQLHDADGRGAKAYPDAGDGNRRDKGTDGTGSIDASRGGRESRDLRESPSRLSRPGGRRQHAPNED